MDTVITSLPPTVGTILMDNISIIQIVSMFSIGAYNGLETGIVAFDAFKGYRSLYFWSIQVASWGIVLHALPAMARFLTQASNIATSVPFVIGWYAMVTGQAIVLYSRLHFVVSNVRTRRCVLWMIIINACILHIPMTVLFFGLTNGDARLARPAAIFDRIQLTAFCVQDSIICSIYVYESALTFKKISTIRGQNSRSAIIHLLWINILVVFLNVLLLVTEYKLHYIQVSFKMVVYSIKLKLEFSVLNRLTSLLRSCTCQRESGERRRSSGRNLFNKLLPQSATASTTELRPAAQGEVPDRRIFPTCFQRKQGARRETSSECMTPPGNTSYSRRTSECQTDTHQAGSSETLPALELTLSEFSPKFDV
ncbi:uncharacterized protein N7511_001777 [Penicillium nucicola]|uniref:uncharacterized protein n=1 Tax=Penicillium nucicola TaxID=1850975 RepID=UPI00254548E2|nr:uncharacterized protein N7511_001777 [Penicillium nucicola]KAJ5769726.1 hypothetical protein N7511_001777 [Penicillium nucicola]